MNYRFPCVMLIALILVGCGSSEDKVKNDEPSDDMPSLIDAQPVNLKAVAYTDTEIEIFWEPSETDASVIGFDILRDGKLVSAKLDAKSYYDNTVLPGVLYEYRVIAVDMNDSRSEPATLEISTPEAYTTINVDNYLAVLDYLASIINTGFSDSTRELVESFYNGDENENNTDLSELVTLTDSGFDPDSGSKFSDYLCQQGGTYRSIRFGSVYGGGAGEFDQCHFGLLEVNGDYSVTETLIKYVFNPGWSQDKNYNLEISNPGQKITTTLAGDSMERRGQYEHLWTWKINQFESPSFQGKTLISDYYVRMTAGAELLDLDVTGEFQRSLDTTFRVQSPATGNKPVSVTTSEILKTGLDSGTYRTGILLISGEDDSSMIVNLGNDDPDTFGVTVNMGETTFPLTLPHENFRLRCIRSGTEASRPDPNEMYFCE